MPEKCAEFQVSQKALLIRDNKILIVLDRNTKKWDAPGGRIDKGEEGEPSFRREVKEELGFDEFKIISAVDYHILYDARSGIPYCTTANLIENENDEIKLSDEHLEYKWIKEEEIDKYNFIYPEDNRLFKKAFEYYRLLKRNEK